MLIPVKVSSDMSFNLDATCSSTPITPRRLDSQRCSVDGVEKCTNVYDVRLEDDDPYCGMQWPPELKNITIYLDVTTPIRVP